MCIVCALAFGLPACAHRTHEAKTANTSSAGINTDKELTPRNAYACASGQHLATQFNPSEQKLALSVDDALYRLDQIPSSSGAKFANAEITFWSKGDEANLQIAGVTTQCERVASAP